MTGGKLTSKTDASTDSLKLEGTGTDSIWTGGSIENLTIFIDDSDAGLDIADSGGNFWNGTTFINDGHINWIIGDLAGGNGSTITNNANFNDSADARFYNFSGGTAPVFTNASTGTYNKTGSGTTEFDSTFDNSGTVNVNAGILKLDGGGTTSATGSFAVASGATLQFDNTYAIADASRLTGLGQFQVTGGTVTLDGTIGVNNFLIQGGVIAGTHTFTNGATWTDGSFASSGTTTNDSGSVFNIGNSDNNHFSSRAFVNNGTMNWTAGALTGGTGSTITNNADFNDSADARFYNFSGGTAPVFTNTSTGTYNKIGSGTTEFDSTFDNSGTVNVNAGILKLDGGGTTSATGSFAVASGATLQFDNTYAIADASRLTGLGQFQVTGGTVTLDGTIGVNNFLIQGGVVAGTHTFTNGATWTDGSFASSGTTTNDSGSVFNISNSDNNHFSSRAFVNNGTMNWTTGALTGGTGSTITNNGIFNDSADARFYNFSGGTAPVFTNTSTGTYNKINPGTTEFDSTFNNSGTVNINAGNLKLDGGASFAATSTLTLTNGGYVQSTGATNFVSGSSITGSGTFYGDGGTLTGETTFQSNFEQNGAMVDGSFNFDSGWTYRSGTVASGRNINLQNTSVGVIAATSFLDLDASNLSVDTNASLEWRSGTIRTGNGAGLTVKGLMTTTFDGEMNQDLTGNGFLDVSGSFRKTSGTGTSTFDLPVTVSGRFETHTGSVLLTAGGTSNAGLFDAWSGTSITFTNGFTFNNNTTAPNGGDIVLSGGTFALNDNVSLGQHALISGGTVTGTHTLSGNIEVNGGVFDSSGSTTIGSGAAIKFSHVEDNPLNRTFTNDGQMEWTNSEMTGSGGNSLINSGTFNAATDGSFSSPTSDFSVTNSGSFGKTAGTGTTTISVPFTNQGRVFANTGTLHFADTFTFTSGSLDPDGGRISFAHTLQLPTSATLRGNGSLVGNFQVGGNVSPGNSIGSLNITGDLTLLSTSTSFFEVNASTDPASADLVSVSGTLTLNGNLSWDLLASLDPIKTDTFTLYSAGNLTGSFLNVANGGRVYTGDMQRSFVVNYGSGSIFDPNSVVFSNFEFTPIPEPSTWALMITGLWLIAWRGGRSRARRQRS